VLLLCSPSTFAGADVDDPFHLERFVRAQDDRGVFAAALRELQEGRKRSHWMWFVFPQIAGLGRSSTAQYYAISSMAEAKAYLAHPVLGPRLVDGARALTALPGSDPVAVLGGIYAQKLRSSMTLFARADPEARVFRDVLDQYFSGQEDDATIARL